MTFVYINMTLHAAAKVIACTVLCMHRDDTFIAENDDLHTLLWSKKTTPDVAETDWKVPRGVIRDSCMQLCCWACLCRARTIQSVKGAQRTNESFNLASLVCSNLGWTWWPGSNLAWPVLWRCSVSAPVYTHIGVFGTNMFMQKPTLPQCPNTVQSSAAEWTPCQGQLRLQRIWMIAFVDYNSQDEVSPYFTIWLRAST